MGLFDAEDVVFPAIPAVVTDDEASQYAAQVADWLGRSVPWAVLKRLSAALDASKPDDRAELRMVLDWWNGLADENLVCHRVRSQNPAAEILSAWKAFQRHATAQECLANLDAVRSEIARSSFCRAGWFRLEKLLRGATNKAGIPICRVLMDGGYRDEAASEADPRGNQAAAAEFIAQCQQG